MCMVFRRKQISLISTSLVWFYLWVQCSLADLQNNYCNIVFFFKSVNEYCTHILIIYKLKLWQWVQLFHYVQHFLVFDKNLIWICLTFCSLSSHKFEKITKTGVTKNKTFFNIIIYNIYDYPSIIAIHSYNRRVINHCLVNTSNQ